MGEVIELVNKQADDEGLWFIAETASEAYLQQELRKLHAAIEGTYDFGNPILSVTKQSEADNAES